MLCEIFNEQLNKEELCQKEDSIINMQKIQEVNALALELGIKKMEYEHPGQIAWKHRWENAPMQRL